jgi:hypothetical protein
MCNSLFFVKAMQFAHLLRAIPEVVEARNKECNAMPLGGDDGYTRLVLSIPEVVSAFRKELSLQHFRLRLAFASEFMEYPHAQPAPRLEIYDLDGKLLRDPIALHELPEALSNVVEVELMYVLLLSKGVNITMY